MRLLVLGGTKFIGRHLVEHALAEGHEVTLFNRGVTGADLFPGVARLVGDRWADDGGLAALAERSWDAVFDFSGFLPAQVNSAARLLAPRIGHYTFMSSIAVYPRTDQIGLDESTPVRALVPLPGSPESQGFTADTYGPLKAACEQAVEAAVPGRATSIRSGLVTGPGDPFGAFASWAVAMAGDGPVPCAARPEQPLQLTDVRDLVAFMVRTGTEPLPGIFNVMSAPITFADMLETCGRTSDRGAEVRWTQQENIDEHGAGIVQPHDGSEDSVFQLDCNRALEAGYRPRPFEETARDTIDWARRTNPVFTSPH
ncbi:NAD-dependent epimerase/dehydratase family protein [Streptacidiphilus carbonis]|uniref:NAD-dependent epimerase/dehydratase family protein n=1 Tax=Streptacidiphilus carbonis TaxID=105422 RepID=UPI0005AB931C|nr:NAD-dependent epimerase/dehydratase family protein [Streptacidiphilus carbonis]